MSDPQICNVCQSPVDDCDCPRDDVMQSWWRRIPSASLGDVLGVLAVIGLATTLTVSCMVDPHLRSDDPIPIYTRGGAEPETLIVPPGALDVVRLGIAVRACPMLEQFICNEPWPPEYYDFIYYTGYQPPENPEGWRVHWIGDAPPPNADFWNYFVQWASLTPAYRAAVIQYLRDNDVMP